LKTEFIIMIPKNVGGITPNTERDLVYC